MSVTQMIVRWLSARSIQITGMIISTIQVFHPQYAHSRHTHTEIIADSDNKVVIQYLVSISIDALIPNRNLNTVPHQKFYQIQ